MTDAGGRRSWVRSRQEPGVTYICLEEVGLEPSGSHAKAWRLEESHVTPESHTGRERQGGEEDCPRVQGPFPLPGDYQTTLEKGLGCSQLQSLAISAHQHPRTSSASGSDPGRRATTLLETVAYSSTRWLAFCWKAEHLNRGDW